MEGSVEGSAVLTGVNSLADFIQSGGIFMWVILIIWAVGIAISLERFMKLSFKFDVDGSSFMNELQIFC